MQMLLPACDINNLNRKWSLINRVKKIVLIFGLQERGSADHKRRWSSLRLYLCGDEISAAAEDENDDDDDGTVSVKSFETCAMPQEPQAAALTVARPANGVDGVADAGGHPEEHGSMSIPIKDIAPPTAAEPATDSQVEAATMIQSVFRGFMVRS